ncbi:MAG: exodeoxyribonuclease V subunit gamma [Brevinematia bacterium]
MLKVTLSNNIGELLNLLYEKIKEKRKSFFDYFDILVSSVNYKRTIEEHFLKKENVCMNLKFSFLEYFLAETFIKMLGLDENKVVILTLERNKVILNSLIFSILTDEDFERKYKEIFRMLLRDNFSENYKTNFLWNLSEKLTDLFREYEYHRYNEIIKNWKNSSFAYGLNPQKIELFQKEIFSKIFFSGKMLNSDEKKYFSLTGLFEEFINNKSNLSFDELKKKKTIYLFGFSQISKIHLEMLLSLENYFDFKIFMPAYAGTILEKNNLFDSFPYQLSIENEGEKLLPIDREFDIIDDLLSPVTGTLYLIRSLLKPENVSISWSKNEANSLLSGVKRLFMERRKSKFSLDDSIIIFSASSRMQEIEAIYNSILYNIQNDKNLKFDDILILVPDMKEYRNIIKDVFGRNPFLLHPNIKKEKSIPFHIYEKNAFKESLFNSLLSSFFNIIENNLSKFDLLSFLENPLLIKKFNIETDDLIFLRKWIESLNAFDEDNKFKFSTFSNLLKRLKLGFIMESNNLSYNGILPYADKFTDIKRLDAFVQIIEKLLFYRKEASGEKRLTEWIEIIKKFINDFVPAKFDDEISEENQIIHNFMRNLKLLEEIENLLKDKVYSFDKAKLHFLNIMTEILERNVSSLFNGVTVSNFLPMRSIPFKIIYITGMNEGEFPSEPDRSSLNLRNLKSFYNDIDRRHMDNFLFLEAIFAAEKKVYISYTGMNLEEDTELYPSSTLLAFINVISEFLLEEELKILKLPKSSLSEEYIKFDEKADVLTNIFYTPHRMISYLKSGMKLHGEDKKPVRHLEQKETSGKIKIKSLASFVINPIEETIRRKDGIYNNMDIELETKETRALELDSRCRAKIFNTAIPLFIKNYLLGQKRIFREIYEEVYKFYYYNGDIPDVEILNKIEKERITCETIEKNLTEVLTNINEDQFYEAIYIGYTSKEMENKKYYEIDIPVEGVIENIILKEDTLLYLRGKNKIDKTKIKFDFHYIFYKLFASFLALCDKNIDKGKIIFLDLEGKKEEQNITLLDRDTINELISYYTEEENFDLLPLSIINKTEDGNEIIEMVEEQLKEEHSFFDLCPPLKTRRDLNKFLPENERLTKRINLLRKIISA